MSDGQVVGNLPFSRLSSTMNSTDSDNNGDDSGGTLRYESAWQCPYVFKGDSFWKCMAPGCSIYDKPRSGLLLAMLGETSIHFLWHNFGQNMISSGIVPVDSTTSTFGLLQKILVGNVVRRDAS